MSLQVLIENGSNGYLVGSKLTLADICLLEPLLWIEELLSDELKDYPETQVIIYDIIIYLMVIQLNFYSQKFLKNVKNNANIANYLSGPLRPRINDDRYIAEVKKVLKWQFLSKISKHLKVNSFW